MRFSVLISFCVLFSACAGDTPTIDAANFPRATDGKADELSGFDPTLSCAGLCDAMLPIATMCGANECQPSDGYCFCDVGCLETGDCCDDFSTECAGSPEVLCDATGGIFENGECGCAQDGASANYVFSSLGCVSLAQLCDRTGGVSEDSECACVQDGASSDHVFSLPAGCTNRAMLCENSGGVFEDGECGCVQDGASAHFSFFPLQGGCALPETTSIEELFGLDATLEASAIDADVGVYVITEDRVRRFDTIDDALQATPQVDLRLLDGFCDIATGETADQCTDVEGQCFLSRTGDEYLSTSMLDENMAGSEQHSEADINVARQLEAQLTYQATVLENGLDLYFTYIEGAYTLVAIKFTECG